MNETTRAAARRAVADMLRTPGTSPEERNAALRQAVLDRLAADDVVVDPARIRKIVEAWRPEDGADDDYDHGRAYAMECVAFMLARAVGVDTAPYRTT